jgi:hypothetical protein
MNGIPEEIMTAPNCAVFESIPDRFLDCPAERLAERLPGAVPHGSSRTRAAPFVCFRVVAWQRGHRPCRGAQEVLRRHLSRELHRSLLLFVGNVAAAAANVRTLPGQADYNRIWPGTPTPDIPEAHMARWVFDYAASRRPFAGIDIHNNTGLNPHYACITRLAIYRLGAALFPDHSPFRCQQWLTGG